MKKRSRFERGEPKPLWWQERDEQIVVAIYEHGVLSTQQIAELFFGGSLSAASKRLRKLYDAQMLQRAFRPKGIGAPEALYLVERTPEAVQRVAEGLGLNEETVRRKWFPMKMLTDHFLEVTAFRVQIEKACQRNDVLLELWEDERECTEKYQSNGQQTKVFAPDAYFRLFRDGKLWAYYLEWDRGTEALGRIRQKAESYAEYWQGGFYTQRYGLKGFRVLWVTTSGERMAMLQETTKDVEGAPPFWWATREQVQGCRDLLTEPIWMVQGTRRDLLS